VQPYGQNQAEFILIIPQKVFIIAFHKVIEPARVTKDVFHMFQSMVAHKFTITANPQWDVPCVWIAPFLQKKSQYTFQIFVAKVPE